MGRLRQLLALLLILLTCNATADKDHDEAFRLRESQAIMPIDEVLQQLGLEKGSRVLEVELEREDGVLIYEIEYLAPDGVVNELLVDPRNGKILRRDREN